MKSVRWQFAGSNHNVTEVESGVVHVTYSVVRMIGWTGVLEWRLDPTQAGQVTTSQHVHTASVSLD